MKTLWRLNVGEQAVVAQISQDVDVSLRQRLEDVGFRQGRPVSCVQVMPFGGPKVFCVGPSRFSLEDSVAEKIEVSGE